MTKAGLIEELCRAMEMTRKDSEEVIDAIFGGVIRALHAGDKIEIRGSWKLWYPPAAAANWS